MALDIKVNTNLKNVQSRYSKFIGKLPRIITRGLEQAGENLKEVIIRRTSAGLDYKRKRFQPYSEAYSNLKNKTRVDLQDTNRMLQNISSRIVNRKRASVYFRSQLEAEKAMYHQTGAGNLPVRRFFDHDIKLRRVIQKNFAKYIEKQIRGLGLWVYEKILLVTY